MTMTRLCAYFQIHQPHRLRRVRVFDIGAPLAAGAAHDAWFDSGLDRDVLDRVVERCYRPAARQLLDHARRYGSAFRVGLGVTSTVLAQLEEAAPDVVDLVGELVASGSAEVLGETSHHTLAWLFDREEFARQVEIHRDDVQRRFGVTPTVFRNTELLYDDGLGSWLAARGYRAVLAEGADRFLAGRPATRVYAAATAPELRILPRHYRLSDDVGFRIEHAAGGRPLSARTWARWIAATGGDSVNVFLDFETFGEHHGPTSLRLLEELPEALARAGVAMHLPCEAAALEPAATLSAPGVVSWADEARDESAWLGNAMQKAASAALYGMLPDLHRRDDRVLLEAWRRLATSDHAYYMSTKGFGDGEVHAHFRPYESPYEAHLNFMNVVADLASPRRCGPAPDAPFPG
jgi:alpha-amylase